MVLFGAGWLRGAAPGRCRAPAPATELRRIVWTDEALANLEAITDYISAFNPVAAERLAGRLIELADGLAEYSERGRGAGGGRREMTIV
jgi:toxin ParE1/3/4